MAELWKETKEPDASDRYSLTIDPLWFGEETIVSSTWEVEDGSGITVSQQLVQDNVVSAQFSGGSTGHWCIKAQVTTETRTKPFCAIMVIKNCC